LENAARQSLFTADEIAKHDKKVGQQAVKSISNLANKIASKTKGADTMGADIQGAVRSAVDDAVKLRKASAKVDYGKADILSDGQKVLQKNNFVKELEDIISEYSGRGAADAKAVSRTAKNLLKDATKKTKGIAAPKEAFSMGGVKAKPVIETQAVPKQFTVNDLVADRSFYGAAAQGTGNVFKDVERNLNRQIASRLHSALTKDMIEGEADDVVGMALKKANDKYAANSQSIKAIQESPLGKMLGDDVLDAADLFGAGSFNTVAGEKVAGKILKLHPTEIRTTMGILERINPQVADDMRAFVVRDAMDAAMPPPSAGAGQPISFNKFRTNMDKVNWKEFGFKPQDIKQMNRIMKAMERVGDRSGYNWSGTEVQRGAKEMLDGIWATATGNVSKAASTAFQWAGLKRIAKAMTSKEGREALIEITKPQMNRGKWDKAFSTIESLGVRTIPAASEGE